MAATNPKSRESTPPPIIGKAGRYTVFLTPPSTPRPPSNLAESPKVIPPVQPPPPQFDKPIHRSSNSSFGFFWSAVAKVQDVHSSFDEYLADLFGLNQSKYQWALNDYYESKGMEKDGSKPKELANKGPNV
ncbi:uncharacterized protein LOC143879708 [Tasmannia lanceolata]|uniref:uncharacterized protein LOC143879708 n=1 Tax=Tasmannia lanceolata TaxID=3420 RepID=UPI00406359E0